MADILSTLDEFTPEQIAFALDAKRVDEYATGVTLKAVKAYIKLVKSNRQKAKRLIGRATNYDCTKDALREGRFYLPVERDEHNKLETVEVQS